MAQYKKMGDLLVAKPSRSEVEEVPVGELSRATSAVLARVLAGSRAVITKHGTPVAVLMELEEAVGLCGIMLLTRREAERRLLGDQLDAELRYRGMRRPRLLGGE